MLEPTWTEEEIELDLDELDDTGSTEMLYQVVATGVVKGEETDEYRKVIKEFPIEQAQDAINFAYLVGKDHLSDHPDHISLFNISVEEVVPTDDGGYESSDTIFRTEVII